MTKGVAVDKAVPAQLKELRRVKKAYEQLKLLHDLLKKGDRVHFRSKAEIFAFIEHQQDLHPVMAFVSTVWRQRERVLRVARSSDQSAGARGCAYAGEDSSSAS